MSVITIQDFSGMMPLRDGILLPDRNAQYAKNAWLYKGNIRGFRHGTQVYTILYSDTQQIYRIPLTSVNPPDFTEPASLWMEFPDPYMSVIRNPVVGDQFNRYYFFPSDQCNATGANPGFSSNPGKPIYNTLDRIIAGDDPFWLGIPTPVDPPIVTSAAAGLAKTATANAPAGSTTLTLSDTTGLSDGMSVTDTSATTVTHNTTRATSPASGSIFTTAVIANTSLTDVIDVASTAGMAVGMLVFNSTNPSSVAPGTTIRSLNPGSQIQLSTNLVGTVNVSDVIEARGEPDTLIMNSVTGILIGMTIIDSTNPSALIVDTTVTGISGLAVTMSQAVASSGVGNGDSIQFKNDPLPAGTVIATGGVVDATHVNITLPTVGAGVLAGDTIQFDVTDIENRAYVYTYISAYGEEGAASPPTNATGNPTGTWTITIPAPDPSVNDGRNLAKIRLYRTVVDSSGNAAYYQVTEFGPPFPTTDTIYSDSATPLEIVNNSTLTSELYTPPPEDLQGVVMMANGIAAGWSNEREIWFSAAYLPHAWPASYALTVDYPIVGLTANGASLNILCRGAPFIATGVTPDTMTIGKISSNEPCISRGSIVSSGEGAYYASPNGIILLNASGTLSITEFIYEKEFHNRLQPDKWAAGHFGMQYVSFIKGAGLTGVDTDGLALHGFVLDKEDKNTSFTFLRFPTTIVNMYFDELSGQLFEILSNGQVLQWNPPIGTPGSTTLWDWTWASKLFRAAFPTSFKAIKTIFDIPPEVIITPGVRNTDQSQVYDPATQYLTIKVYADGVFVMVKEVQKSEEILLIPDGFKATIWQLRLQGQVSVLHLKMATSVKELRKA